MTVSQRDKQVLLWGGIFCVCILLYTYLLDPALKSFSEHKEEVAYQKHLLQKYRSAASHKEAVEKLAMGIDAKIAELDKKFLQGETEAVAAAKLQAYLQSAAASVKGSESVTVNGKTLTRPLQPIHFLRSRVEKPEVLGRMERITVQVDFNTRIRSLLRFIDTIEKSETVLSIRKLLITVVDIRHPKDLRVSMKIAGYIRARKVKREEE